MRVVHLTDTTLSGAPYRLMKVQRISGIDARCIHGTEQNDYRTSWTDLLVTNAAHRDAIMENLRTADIIHFHNRLWKQRLFGIYPEARKIVESKPKVIQFHSPRDQLERDTPDSFRIKCPKLVVAQYQVRLYPEAKIVPNVVPLDDTWHHPIDRTLKEGDLPYIGFSPSNLNDFKWDNKGYKFTKITLETLTKAHKARANIITNMPLTYCLLMRRECDIVIDEVMTGSYHMVSLEALAAGQVAIANLDEKTIDALEYVTGTRKHPWVVTNSKNLYNTLVELCSDANRIRTIQKESREYMEKYWDPFRVTKFFTNIYEAEI